MPAGGAIGTACDVPETATISNPAAAIATTVRVIPFSLSFSSSANLGEHITRRHDGSSTAPVICKHERAARIVFDSPTSWRTNLHGRVTEVTAPLFKNLKQVALARISRTATRFAGGTGRSLNRRAAFGARRYATVGKFDIERHASGDGPCAAQRLALGISH